MKNQQKSILCECRKSKLKENKIPLLGILLLIATAIFLYFSLSGYERTLMVIMSTIVIMHYSKSLKDFWITEEECNKERLSLKTLSTEQLFEEINTKNIFNHLAVEVLEDKLLSEGHDFQTLAESLKYVSEGFQEKIYPALTAHFRMLQCAPVDCKNNPAYEKWYNERKSELKNELCYCDSIGGVHVLETFFEDYEDSYIFGERKLEILKDSTDIIDIAEAYSLLPEDYEEELDEKLSELIETSLLEDIEQADLINPEKVEKFFGEYFLGLILKEEYLEIMEVLYTIDNETGEVVSLSQGLTEAVVEELLTQYSNAVGDEKPNDILFNCLRIGSKMPYEQYEYAVFTEQILKGFFGIIIPLMTDTKILDEIAKVAPSESSVEHYAKYRKNYIRDCGSPGFIHEEIRYISNLSKRSIRFPKKK